MLSVQNQIAAQQASHIRQQAQQQQQQQSMGVPKPSGGPPCDFFKQGAVPDQFAAAFTQMNLGEPSPLNLPVSCLLSITNYLMLPN